LIVVVPWVLGNVISGSPLLFEPFVESARFAAQYRNYHWQHIRTAKSDVAIDVPPKRATKSLIDHIPIAAAILDG
jgi:hypothetical protein